MEPMWGARACVLMGIVASGCAAVGATGVHGQSRAAAPSSQLHLAMVARGADVKKESPAAHACRAGSSRACNDLGDRLMIKHAYEEARSWYVLSCERARGAMMPTATELLHLSHDLAQPSQSGARGAGLKADAAELTARLRGCYDTAEILRTEHELGQALPYYEAACEFSALSEAVGETVPSFAPVVERACAGTQAARSALRSAAFTPELFEPLAAQAREEAAAASAAKAASEQPQADMVFSMSEL